MNRVALRIAVISATALPVTAAGCSRSSSSGTTATTADAVLQAPVTESDFCDLMLAVQSDARADDASVDQDELLTKYREALAVAPDEVRDDLQQVIDSMSTPSATTVTAFVEGGVDDEGEGWSPAPTPGGRVIDYVDAHCAGISANPGPAATPPEP